MLLAPSVIASDLGRLEAQAREALSGGADWLHVDVMDGRFVPNISVGPLIVEALRPLADETGAPLDVHLMIEDPARYIGDFAEAGADGLTLHVEAAAHLHRALQEVRERGLRVGVTLNPSTPLVMLEEVLPLVDMVLVMSVNPGFSGQSYLPQSTQKIRRLREMLNAIGSGALIQVDGGVKPENVQEVVGAGADVVVAGSAVFGGERSVEGNIRAFREALVLEA